MLLALLELLVDLQNALDFFFFCCDDGPQDGDIIIIVNF